MYCLRTACTSCTLHVHYLCTACALHVQYLYLYLCTAGPSTPVIAVLAHVDHGKTTLLDKLMGTNVAAGEVGLITQSVRPALLPLAPTIGGFSQLAFIDTPGHQVGPPMRTPAPIPALSLASPRLACPRLASPHRTAPHLASPHLTSPHLTSPHLTAPYRTSPHLTSPHRTSPHLTSPHLTSPHLTSA